MTVNFTASSCLSPDSWVAIFPASLPHGDDLASAGHLVSGRARLQGKQAGVLSFNAPDKAGAYQLRMFDAGTGRELTYFEFTVGSAAITMSGLFEDLSVRPYRKYFKIEVFDNGASARIGPWEEKDSISWKPWKEGKISGNAILYMNLTSCPPYSTDKRKEGESRNVPIRILFDANRRSFKIQSHRYDCDRYGKMKITAQWGGARYNYTRVK